jgi:hypothetical protein
VALTSAGLRAAELPCARAPGESACGAPEKRRRRCGVPRACAAEAPPPSSDGREGAPVGEEREWAG